LVVSFLAAAVVVVTFAGSRALQRDYTGKADWNSLSGTLPAACPHAETEFAMPPCGMNQRP
jgi:hypothetical protein